MPKSKQRWIPEADLRGKTVIVTGANTGIGRETARELARFGARVILACRSRERGEDARQDIVQDTNNQDVAVKILDLSSLQSVKAFADDINSIEKRLDILVNNAGVFMNTRQETKDGFEMTFGVNHLGHFYLTCLLLDKLKASAPSRIVIVSSRGHTYGKVNFNDLQFKQRSFQTIAAYNSTKTANILHGVQLAKILKGSGVSVYSLHPGVIKDTELGRDLSSFFYRFFWSVLIKLTGVKIISVQEGALTTLYCCVEPSIAEHSGRYYSDCQEKSAKNYATSEKNAQRLWEVSVELCESVSAPIPGTVPRT